MTRASSSQHRLALGLCLAGLLVAVTPLRAEDAAGTNGQALFDASFKNLKDQMESLSTFKGKVTVVYFWATWCVPCRIETPKLVKLYTDYKAKGVEVVGIALDNGDKVRDFVREYNVNYPIFYGNAVKLGKALGNSQGAIPYMVVLDKAGKVVETFQGDLPDGKLEAVIDPLNGS